MQYRNNRFTIKSDINIVPFLDVLLVLLLSFMVTVPIINQSVEVKLPDASMSKQISVSDSKTVIIEVSHAGVYNFIFGNERHSDVQQDRLLAEVKQRFLTNEGIVFLIGGDKYVAYEEIVKVLNLLQSIGVKSVGLMTEPIQ